MSRPAIDYDKGAAAYQAARTLPDGVLAAWRDAVVGLGLAPVALIADIGSGTGQFLRPLASWFGASVVGVEPSAGMRAASRPAVVPGAAVVVAGTAEALPLRSGRVDIAWLSTVVHQIRGLDRAVRELHRVVRPGGRVLVRGYFADLPMGTVLRRFPGIDRVVATFPTTGAVVEACERGGLWPDAVTPVTEVWTFDRSVWAERARSLRHVDSAFRPLTDAEFDAGVAAALGPGGTDPGAGPLVSEVTLNLVVLRRP